MQRGEKVVRTLIYVMLIYVPPTIIFFKRLARQLMAIRALWGALVISLDSHFTFLLTRKRREGEIERMRAGERERERVLRLFSWLFQYRRGWYVIDYVDFTVRTSFSERKIVLSTQRSYPQNVSFLANRDK